MARRGLFIPILGDPASLIKAIRESKTELRSFGSTAKEVSDKVAKGADRQVAATVALDKRLREQITRYRQVAAAASKGSREQVVATNLANEAEKKLARSLGVTTKEARSHARAVAGAEREVSKFARGAAAGSGLASGLGRSLAFASGGFLATATIGGLLRSSIDAATEDAAAQRQIAAQFRANQQDLGQYRDEIEKATLAESRLSGFTATELTRSFTLAFRATRNVSEGLKIQAVSADLARARGKDLLTTTTALVRAYAGSAASLRRIGVLIPTNLKGMAALNYVQARVAGQAAAGTTAQQRFAAAVHNTEVSIGRALLPTLTAYLNKATKWLDNTENQKRVQHDVSTGAKVLGGALTGVGKAFGFLTSKQGQALTGFTLTKAAFHGLKTIVHAVNTELSSYSGNVERAVTGEDVFLRGSTRVAGVGVPITGRRGARPKASLDYRISIENLRLAQAAATRGKADDRAALVILAELTRQKIAKTKDLAQRTSLYNQLASINDQINAIDLSASQKRLAAQRKANEAAKKLREKEARERRKGIQQAAEDTRKAAQEAQQQRQTIQSAIDAARSAIGDLFTGSYLNPSEAQQKRALGAPVPGANARALVKDLQSQIKAFRAFQSDLARLARRGAPPELLAELRAQGLPAAPEVHALATAGRGTLGQFLKAFGQREQLVARTAKATLHAQRVEVRAQRLVVNAVAGKDLWKPTVYVYVDGKVQKARVKTTPHGQTRGRSPGVPSR